jgi:Holliday junction resolvase RusA-like endonuclease
MVKVDEIVLEFPQFITHVKKSKNKYMKIGYNQLYSGVHFSLRSKLINQMHEYILPYIPNISIQTPVETYLELHVPKNYSDVKMLTRKGTGEKYLNWKAPAEGYSPNWDLDNLVVAWLKAINDCLEKKGIIPDDCVEYVTKKTEEYIPCEHIDDRKIVFTIKTRK